MRKTRQIQIEWRHLDSDGSTCGRCDQTGTALQTVIAALGDECRPSGWTIRLVETRLDADAIAESNSILIDGRPIESLLPGSEVRYNPCDSCGELIGHPADCRTVTFGTISHDAIPGALIRSAVCRAVPCCG